MSDDGPRHRPHFALRSQSSGCHPTSWARRHVLADRLIAEEDAREAAERNRWREASEGGR